MENSNKFINISIKDKNCGGSVLSSMYLLFIQVYKSKHELSLRCAHALN